MRDDAIDYTVEKRGGGQRLEMNGIYYRRDGTAQCTYLGTESIE